MKLNHAFQEGPLPQPWRLRNTLCGGTGYGPGAGSDLSGRSRGMEPISVRLRNGLDADVYPLPSRPNTSPCK